MTASTDLEERLGRARSVVGIRRHRRSLRAVQQYASWLASLRFERAVRSVMLVLAVAAPTVLLLVADARESGLLVVTAFLTEVALLAAALAGSDHLVSWAAKVDVAVSRGSATMVVGCILIILLLTAMVVVATTAGAWSTFLGFAGMALGLVAMAHAFLEPVVVASRRQVSAYLPMAVCAAAWSVVFLIAVAGSVALARSGLMGRELATAVGIASATGLAAAMSADLRRQRRVLTELVVAVDELVSQLRGSAPAAPPVQAAWLRVERALGTAFIGRPPVRVLPVGDTFVVAALRQYRLAVFGAGEEPRGGKGRVDEIAASLGSDVRCLPRAVALAEAEAFLVRMRSGLARWVDVAA